MNNSNTLTKDGLAAQLAAKTGMTQVQAHEALTHTFGLIQDALVSGQKVEFRGFGAFVPKMRMGRVGRNLHNPQAGPVQIPPKRVVRFKTGTLLGKALNQPQPPQPPA